ncbi:transcriptional repressor, partial [Candidatus Woesearchaeota archaeon]|nr:transcriptional repressor [Candidatus Woesearchaeota archaeon]
MERLTQQRKIILEELKKVKTHPKAPDIYSTVRKRIKNVSLGTVYRNLESMAKEGKIIKIGCNNFSRFDGNATNHPHFLCEKCQKVLDIEQEIKLKFDEKNFEKK